MCADAQRQGAEVIVMHHLEVLGDDFAEIVESLNRIATAVLALKIIPTDH